MPGNSTAMDTATAAGIGAAALGYILEDMERAAQFADWFEAQAGPMPPGILVSSLRHAQLACARLHTSLKGDGA